VLKIGLAVKRSINHLIPTQSTPQANELYTFWCFWRITANGSHQISIAESRKRRAWVWNKARRRKHRGIKVTLHSNQPSPQGAENITRIDSTPLTGERAGARMCKPESYTDTLLISFIVKYGVPIFSRICQILRQAAYYRNSSGSGLGQKLTRYLRSSFYFINKQCVSRTLCLGQNMLPIFNR